MTNKEELKIPGLKTPQTRKGDKIDLIFPNALGRKSYDLYKEDVAVVNIYFESPSIVEYSEQRTMTM